MELEKMSNEEFTEMVKAEKEQPTKVKRIKLDGGTSLRNGMVAIAYNGLQL